MQIILSSRITSSRTADTAVLGTMLNRMKIFGIAILGAILNADKGYDSDSNCKKLYDMFMKPNILQRSNARNEGKKYRKRAAGEFIP